MQRFLASLVVSGFLIVPALADETDHPRAPWTGPYIGVLGGYDWGTTSTDDFDLTTGDFNNHHTEKRNGYTIGGELGYNWLAYPSILVGIEADISGGRVDGVRDDTGNNYVTHAVSKDEPIGTVRGRIGYVMGSWLLYGTGGYAFVNDEVDRTIVSASKDTGVNGETASPKGFVSGWTAGGGLETEVAAGLTFKVEYLFMDFDYDRDFVYPHATKAATDRKNVTDLELNTVRAALNFHLD